MHKEDLILKFDPHTIEHLGIKMYSQLPYALAELVANAYDAAASKVDILLSDEDANNKTITVTDNGEGMSYAEVQNNFLVIGRKRRLEDAERKNTKGRRVTGRKGVGKLALFGIGARIQIETSKAGEDESTAFVLDWKDILNETSGQYKPNVSIKQKTNRNESGTKLVLSKLTRASNFNERDVSISLSKLFNCFDSDFVVSVRRNDNPPITLTRDLRYEGIDQQFEWDIASLADEVDSDYNNKKELKGKIISSKKPMRQDLRGITLYANGRLVNAPGFFGASEAGHTFTYMSGWIDADFLDEFEDDLISTDRQSLSWDLQETQDLQAYLQAVMKFLVKDWSSKRKEAKRKREEERSGINIQDWTNTMPDKLREAILKTVEKTENEAAIDDESYSSVVKSLHEAIPEYPIYHWRNLHQRVRSASERKYQSTDYYGALEEACKEYCKAIREKVRDKDSTAFSALPSHDSDLVNKVFANILSVSASMSRPDGSEFSELTKDSINNAQRELSSGIIAGYRNPLAHELHEDLSASGVISEQHCLDALSIISLLFSRLDSAEKK